MTAIILAGLKRFVAGRGAVRRPSFVALRSSRNVGKTGRCGIVLQKTFEGLLP